MTNKELQRTLAECFGWIALRNRWVAGELKLVGYAPDNPFPHDKGEQVVPNWPKDPAAAMEVLKKCAERCSQRAGDGVGIEFSTPIVPGVPHLSWCVCQMSGVYEVENFRQTDAETLEVAICQFALSLFGEEKKPC